MIIVNGKFLQYKNLPGKKEKQVPLRVAVKMAASGAICSSDSESKMVICCSETFQCDQSMYLSITHSFPKSVSPTDCL